MPIQKKIIMSKNNPKPATWYDAFKKVRYKTPPAPGEQVIDDETKKRKKERRENTQEKHKWRRGDFE